MYGTECKLLHALVHPADPNYIEIKDFLVWFGYGSVA